MTHAPRRNQEIKNNKCYADEHKIGIHTTLPKPIHGWMMQHAADNQQYLSSTIIMLVEFYKKNKELPEKYNQGILTLQELIRKEIKSIDEQTKTRELR